MTTRIAPKPKRRFLRFTLSSLLLLMLVVCVWLGWEVERARKQREAVTWIQQVHGRVKYDYDIAEWRYSYAPGPEWPSRLNDVRDVDLSATQVSDVTPLAGLTRLKWLHLFNTPVTDVTPLARLTRLEELHLGGTQVSNVTPLAGLARLKWLWLGGTQVSDVTPLARLTRLEGLHLSGTQVSDVTPLAGLTRLKELRLGGTQVSDVTPLDGLTRLEVLNVRGTQVSEEAVNQLKESLPQCHIRSDYYARDPAFRM